MSSIGDESNELITKLEASLKSFYTHSKEYYDIVDFTANNWIDKKEEGYAAIVSGATAAAKICEIGCGQANVLLHHPGMATRYTGCDFSEALLQSNGRRFPDAKFVPISVPNKLPFSDSSFDFVFSVFVIEHSTRPAELMNECYRILAPGGKLMIICPDFLGRNRMTSQRAGWSPGTAHQKLRKGKLIDALITLYDNRIRIPLYCRALKRKIEFRSGFYVNLSPVVFEDPFTPDVDAVYVTYKNEMVNFLVSKFAVNKNSERLVRYEQDHGLIFIEATKSR